MPVLASVLVGDNSASETYVKSQRKIAESLGIDYQFFKLKADTSEEELIKFIEKMNIDRSINGVIILMPLPAHLDCKKIIRHICADKDVEGIHPLNVGKLLLGREHIAPCTAGAVMELLGATGIDLYGKEVVLVGWSEIVGKPLAVLLSEKLATVHICQIGTSQSGNLEKHVRQADVIISAVGKPGLIKGDWVKDGAIVVDVGINHLNNKIVGDVEFESASKHAAYITPVPGGVGPLTVTILMRNLAEAAKAQQS